jgi:hypothetical protein
MRQDDPPRYILDPARKAAFFALFFPTLDGAEPFR